MKKFLSLLLAGLMMFSSITVLSSCFGQPDPSDPPEEPPYEEPGPGDDKEPGDDQPGDEKPEVRTTITEDEYNAHFEIFDYTVQYEAIVEANGSNGTKGDAKRNITLMQNKKAQRSAAVYGGSGLFEEIATEKDEQIILFKDGLGHYLYELDGQYYLERDGREGCFISLGENLFEILEVEYSSLIYDDAKKAYKADINGTTALSGFSLGSAYLYFEDGVITKIEFESVETEEELDSEIFDLKVSQTFIVTDIGKTVIDIPNYLMEPDNGGDTPVNPGDDGYPWKSAEILVQLYENSANDELSSGLKRYYAGEAAAYEEIDTLVRDRNITAEGKTKVKPTYSYENGFGWGASVEDIYTDANSGSANAPDVYCNFAYDMTSAALKGCFANLLSNSSKSSSTMPGGENYFAFAKDDYVSTCNNYFDANSGEGYLYDYMKSLALVNSDGEYDKLYCLASNYTLDVIRSFAVIPVNINMLEDISVSESTGDADRDGDFDLDDFYRDVWDYKWNYDTLARLSSAVYVNNSSASQYADIGDTLGFAVGRSSGFSGAAILYSSSVNIIDKVRNTNGTYTYAYPSSNQGLVEFADVLAGLFRNDDIGVCSISSEDARAAGYSTDLEAIRERFADDKLLFGGVVMLGNLEDEEYQKMNAGKGFGFVPVPVYREGDEYNTFVHNLARVVSIGIGTTEFAQCSAFLDYQSRNSANIPNEYIYEIIAADTDTVENNQKMLTYIRNHARDSFDKTYDDIISNYQSKNDYNAMRSRWHTILYTNGYIVYNMAQKYAEYYPLKQGLLETVLAEWAALQ